MLSIEAQKARKSKRAKRYYERERRRLLEHQSEYYAAHKTDAAERYARTRTVLRPVLVARLSSARVRARKRGLTFNLTIDYILKLYAQDDKCAITRLPFILGCKWATVSIDRIDCNKGYVEGNVRLVRYQVNAALNSWGDAVFMEMCRAAVAAEEQNAKTV